MNNKKNNSMAEVIGQVTNERMSFFKNENDVLYVRVDNEVFEATEEKITDILSKLYPQYEGDVIPLKLATDYAHFILLTKLDTTRKAFTAHRTFFDADTSTFYYDLNKKEVVCVSPDGIAKKPKGDLKRLTFLRSTTAMDQVEPLYEDYSSEQCREVLLKLADFISVSDEDLKIIIVYLVSCFIRQISHPILILTGEAGSSKTTTTKLLKKIVDPSSVDVLTFPGERRDLEFILGNHYFVAFDNLGESSVKTKISDLLCCAVTGSESIKRKLYTDNEEHVIRLKNIILLNGISPNISRADLMQRAILINTLPISAKKRIEESVLTKRFNEYLPSLLCAIFNVLKLYLEHQSYYEITELKRMADFEKAAIIISDLIFEDCNSKNSFESLYNQKYEEGQKKAVEFDPFVSMVQSYIELYGDVEGLPSKVFNELKNANRTSYNLTSANVLTQRLKDKKAMLNSIGIDFESGRRKERFLRIFAMEGYYPQKAKSKQNVMDDLLDLSDDDEF